MLWKNLLQRNKNFPKKEPLKKSAKNKKRKVKVILRPKDLKMKIASTAISTKKTVKMRQLKREKKKILMLKHTLSGERNIQTLRVKMLQLLDRKRIKMMMKKKVTMMMMARTRMTIMMMKMIEGIISVETVHIYKASSKVVIKLQRGKKKVN